ncbi:putative thioredoxin [Glaciihabitans tibetensis]|uniref:Putative thioredoxin n=1 Tax=Glaciihabitans tibetensis TaxID=1266600 RepID=A0A2T0VIA7_9MICO|nr:tetratricopeptide repeat protein [Glaciihabitans tibetensis]PRY69969.1 putative thioredoxin [Glaciihabitans tibetensis]
MTNVPLSPASMRGAVDLSSLVNPRPAPTPVAAPEGGTSSTVVLAADDASFTQVLELSNTVPVVVEFYGQGVAAQLGPIVESYGGRIVLATVDGQANPQLAQAFQVTQIPTVAAVVGGRPVQLYVGAYPDAEVRQVLDQVLELAAKNGVTGVVPAGDAPAVEPVEEPLPPHHQEAFDAIAAGNYEAAIAEYKTAIAQNPRDSLAVAGLAQVSLLHRLDGVSLDEVRSAAATDQADVTAQLAVADLDVSGGHLEDAFDRLLTLFPTLDADGKTAVRTRMLEYFEIAGADDPRVIAGRRRLTGLLY